MCDGVMGNCSVIICVCMYVNVWAQPLCAWVYISVPDLLFLAGIVCD